MVNTSNTSYKRRPTTASRRNQLMQQLGYSKKAIGPKNPSTLDLDISRIRPKNFVQDRERLFDDAMKQKIAANFLKDENVKLKTKVHILENEVAKKEKVIDDLLIQQDQY